MSVTMLENNIVAITDFSGDLTDLANLVNTIDSNLVYNYFNKVYTFNCSLLFENNCILQDRRKSILLLGEYFLFENNSLIELGTGSYKNNKYSGYHGCEVSMPNLKLFGSISDNAGKFKAYNSILDVFCKWNILGPNAGLELVETDISGYGLYKGVNSVLYKVRYLRSSASNGVLRPDTNLGIYEQVEVNGEVILDRAEPGASAIVVDAFSGDMNWEYGTIDNYSNLIEIIDNGTYTGNINLLGTDVMNGYGVYQTANNKHNIYHKFKFSGILYDGFGSILPNYKMDIYNKHNDLEESIMTDEFGRFDTWITYYRNLSGPVRQGEYMTPHTIEIENGVKVKINATRNMINVPLFMHNNTTVVENNTEIKVLIEELKNILVDADVSNKQYLSTLSIALSDKINNVTSTVHKGRDATITI